MIPAAWRSGCWGSPTDQPPQTYPKHDANDNGGGRLSAPARVLPTETNIVRRSPSTRAIRATPCALHWPASRDRLERAIRKHIPTGRETMARRKDDTSTERSTVARCTCSYAALLKSALCPRGWFKGISIRCRFWGASGAGPKADHPDPGHASELCETLLLWLRLWLRGRFSRSRRDPEDCAGTSKLGPTAKLEADQTESCQNPGNMFCRADPRMILRAGDAPSSTVPCRATWTIWQ